MLWPTGVLQDEIEIAGNKVQEFTEIDRRGFPARRSSSGMVRAMNSWATC